MANRTRQLKRGWKRTKARFWREIARKVDPHLSQGIHIDGVKIVGDGAMLAGMAVHGHGSSPAVVIARAE